MGDSPFREDWAAMESREVFDSIPCGLGIYRIEGDRLFSLYHNKAFFEILGYSEEHMARMKCELEYTCVHPEDVNELKEIVCGLIQNGGVIHHTLRIFNDRDREYHWIRLDGSMKLNAGCGGRLLYGVYSDVSEQVRLEKELEGANEKMEDIINTIPGGVAIYQPEGDRFKAAFLSDGVLTLSGHTREDYEYLTRNDALDIIYDSDRQRVEAAVRNTMANGDILDVYYRIRHKNGRLVWLHMNGQRMTPLEGNGKLYIVFTGMSAEARLFQNIANETADAIYVIDKENYDLLYVNGSNVPFAREMDYVGQKCYEAIHGKGAPCSFCTLKTHEADGAEHEMAVDGTERFYLTRFKESDWNGIPSYVKFVRDVTEEVKIRKEKERLEEYFKTVVKNLPGGIAVVRCEADGRMIPEFLSDGFAAMTDMTLERAWQLYKKDAMAGVHPDDLVPVNKEMAKYIENGKRHFEQTYRLITGNGRYIWVKNTISLICSEGGESRFYVVYRDITKEREEQEQLAAQFKERLMQHYGTTDPNVLIMGHCNITQNRILEISDHTDSGLLEHFGSVRETFFTGLSSLVVDEKERQEFLDMYLNAPALEAFSRKDTERILKCFVKLPKEEKGRYVQFKVNLVDAPDTGDVTGILTVTDITEQIIADKILHQLSVTSYDFVVDLNLEQGLYTMLTCNEHSSCLPDHHGSHAGRMSYMLSNIVVPKDREAYTSCLKPEEMRRRLREQRGYTFSYSIVDEHGDVRTKNMTVSEVDLRLGRVCLVRTDITDSVREQQGLLNIMAYTFELVGFINIYSRSLIMYTRQTVLENLSPYVMEDYNEAVELFAGHYESESGEEDVRRQFMLDTIIQQLSKKPSGYDLVFQYQKGDEVRYKQINVLWGDANHRTVCLVRADVTDMLAAERQTKNALEKALDLAREASRAKSDFMSTMSHDIRTPMNAIMGMTALACAHLDDRKRIEDCLEKISVSSKYLLSLINDILDMSKIEQSKITLNHRKISLTGLMEQIASIMEPQAKAAGLRFSMESGRIRHGCFYGDTLRINQIIVNLLSNAVKFTPNGGMVEFLAEELESAKSQRARYCFIVRDTGIGMSQEFLSHIFEPFMRNTTHIEGTGLGLSITKGLVDLMEGTITVESREQVGTVFRVELELEIASDEDEACPDTFQLMAQGAETMFSGRCFLIAEDNDINAEILSELLKMYGANSVLTADGIQVVKAFADAPPGTYDAILMDIRMPGMDGYEATCAIRKMEREDAKQIPIIAMTANAFSEDVQEAMNAGMNAHVAKPIDLDILWSTLNCVLGNVSED